MDQDLINAVEAVKELNGALGDIPAFQICHIPGSYTAIMYKDRALWDSEDENDSGLSGKDDMIDHVVRKVISTAAWHKRQADKLRDMFAPPDVIGGYKGGKPR
jgi:hypothetical protein